MLQTVDSVSITFFPIIYDIVLDRITFPTLSWENFLMNFVGWKTTSRWKEGNSCAYPEKTENTSKTFQLQNEKYIFEI